MRTPRSPNHETRLIGNHGSEAGADTDPNVIGALRRHNFDINHTYNERRDVVLRAGRVGTRAKRTISDQVTDPCPLDPYMFYMSDCGNCIKPRVN